MSTRTSSTALCVRLFSFASNAKLQNWPFAADPFLYSIKNCLCAQVLILTPDSCMQRRKRRPSRTTFPFSHMILLRLITFASPMTNGTYTDDECCNITVLYWLFVIPVPRSARHHAEKDKMRGAKTVRLFSCAYSATTPETRTHGSSVVKR